MSGWPQKKKRCKDKNVVYLDTYYKSYRHRDVNLNDKNMMILARIIHHGDCMGMIEEWGPSTIDQDVSIYD